jgi:DNA-binding GntR family transcriptional regulator
MTVSKGAKLASGSATSLPAPNPVRADSRVAEVIKKIEDAIADGRLVPGQRLVEADLTAEFGASRSVVREALRLLAGEGVVDLTPHRGGRIKRIDPQRIIHMLEVYSALFRASLEILVAKPISRPARDALKAARDNVIKAAKIGSIRDKMNATLAYHFTIASNCGNPYFAEALQRLHIQHYVRQAEITSIHDQINLAETYRNATSRILKRDLPGARLALNPMMARLGEHRREELERTKTGANVLDMRPARTGAKV